MIEINLVGLESKKEKKKSSNAIDIDLKIAIVVAVFLIEFVALGVTTYMMNKKIDVLRVKKNRLSRLEVRVNHIRAKISEVNRMIKAVKGLERNRNMAAIILQEVANAIPTSIYYQNQGIVSAPDGGLWLTRMVKKGNTIIIDGKSFSAEAVADYMMRLQSLKNVKKVKFTSSGLRKIYSKNGIDVYGFSISVTLKG